MFYMYILYNQEIDRFYVGSTSNIESRVEEHNSTKHKTKYTRKQMGAWILVYKEQYDTNLLARRRESQIKSWKSKKKIRSMVEQSRS